MSRKLTTAEKQYRAAWRLGCSPDEYLLLKPMKPSPMKAFTDQRNNAKRRGITWELSLTEWWSIWQQPGHWNDRGIGTNSYCMSRKGDVGPYAVGNVFVGLLRQNSSDKAQKTSGLPIGVYETPSGNRFNAKRRLKGKEIFLGSFLTVDEASAAYLSSVS